MLQDVVTGKHPHRRGNKKGCGGKLLYFIFLKEIWMPIEENVNTLTLGSKHLMGV